MALVGEQGSHAGGGDEVAAPSDCDGIDDFNDGSESDGERAPQSGREDREHKAQTKLHYRLFYLEAGGEDVEAVAAAEGERRREKPGDRARDDEAAKRTHQRHAAQG